MVVTSVLSLVRRLRAMGPRALLWAAAAAGLWACGGKEGDLNVGDAVPAALGDSGGTRLALIATIEDCINCGFRDTFVAVRALEAGTSPPDESLDVALWIVTGQPADTTFVRQLLTRERLAMRLRVIQPAAARAVFARTKIPAVYLIRNRVVVREWEATPAGNVAVRRDEFVEALR